MQEAPPFWWKKPGIAAWLLSPLSLVYGQVSARRMTARPRHSIDLPVLCVGNLIAGGAGKTPTALALAAAARRIGRKPGFLSRGYGGGVTKATLVDPERHNARDVGDEPLLLARKATTVVSPDRARGADLLAEQGIDLVIMDDGFQNPVLRKDFSLVVVDARRGVGNGYCHPAGPLRASLGRQLSFADAVLVIGHAGAAARVVRMAARRGRPVFEAALKTVSPESWNGIEALAYAGIADPDKFYASLRAAGAVLKDLRSFGDHHPFTREECEELMERARRSKLVLATTAKDAARLRGAGDAQQALLAASRVLEVEMTTENPRDLENIVHRAVENFTKRRLAL